jgi:uncharacterized lipoprotein YehR (DUF1307 family)
MKKILATVLAITLAFSLVGCKTRGSSGEENSSVSDSSDESSSLIKTGKKEIGKIENSKEETNLTKNVECEINISDDVDLTQITIEPKDEESTEKPINVDLNKTDLSGLQKALGLKDRKLKNKVSKNKGFLFDGKGYIGEKNGIVTFIENEGNKVKAICFSNEYVDSSNEKYRVSLCGGIRLSSKIEDVRKNIGSGTYMINPPENTKVAYYKNSKATLVIVFENGYDGLVVSEITIINN